MNLESLDKTVWDAVIAGTGLRESLLAAALARAGKRVLHLDKNPYYGDEYAALSLDELEAWAKTSKTDRLQSIEFKIFDIPESAPKLAKSRSYTLNLSPGLLYTASPLLSLLVASNLHESLEFLKVGGWFVYNPTDGSEDPFMRVPNSREDVFNDQTLDPRTKRLVVRALKSIVGLEGSVSTSNSAQTSLQEYLEHPPFQLPTHIIASFTSLTLQHDPPSEILFENAERDIRKHFGSIGRFGPGFAAVVGRYGSGSELVQVLCRAAAVTGNAIYILGNGVTDIQDNIVQPSQTARAESEQPASPAGRGLQLHLQNGDVVWTRHLIAATSNLPSESPVVRQTLDTSANDTYWISLCIVSSPIRRIFRTSEPPTAAAAVVYMPPRSLTEEGSSNSDPVYISVHSSETGECPDGQSILYVTTKGSESKILDIAANSLLQKMPNDDGSIGQILMSLKFRTSAPSTIHTSEAKSSPDGLHLLAKYMPIIEVPDEAVDQVIDVYEAIMGSRDTFMEKIDVGEIGDLREDSQISFE
ncbi:hypothetical protein ABW20_dc0107014 [Dactylellina cionopaga]|nr:hypothetical protein ABW20_dc0107014 [Dactylellina cionopaga]